MTGRDFHIFDMRSGGYAVRSVQGLGCVKNEKIYPDPIRHPFSARFRCFIAAQLCPPMARIIGPYPTELPVP